MTENPHTVHGRLLEAAHVAGYTFKRARDELKWLLEEDRWRSLGFKDGSEFIRSVESTFADLKTSIEERADLVRDMSRVASQRAIADALGISAATVNRDLRPVSNETGATEIARSPASGDTQNVTNETREWFQGDHDPAELVQKEVKKEQKTIDRQQRIEDAKTRASAMPPGKYSVIYADPPWSFKVWSGAGKDRAAENHYPTATLEDICALPVAELAADDCALFMWAVMPQLPEALEVIRAWGFEYKTCAFVWTKTNRDGDKFATGMGYWTRANAEICLLATRGSPVRLNADVHQVVTSPRGEHSAKPEEVAERIERLVAGPYVELFARRARPGWQVWGFDAPEAAA